MTNDRTSRRSLASAPSYAEICRAHDAAVALAEAYRPKQVSLDALQEGALKWWRRLKQGRIPRYIVERHDSSKISVAFLSYWILRSARDFQNELWAEEARMKEHGLASAHLDPELESDDLRDSTALPLDEKAVERMDAERAVTGLGSWEAIDPILRLRSEGLAYKEIAAEARTTVGNARVHAHRERARAERRLTELGLTDL